MRDGTGTILGSYDAAEQLATASVGKLLLLLEVARRCETSPTYAERELTRTGVDPVGDSGLWQHLRVDTLGVTDLAVLVASVSDNLATNILLRDVGLDAIGDLGRRLGLRVTRLLDLVRDERSAEDPPTLSLGNADELSQVMADLNRGRLISAGVSAQLKQWLSTGVDLSMVASAFGLDPLAHPADDGGLTLVNKTGSDRGIRADVGAVTGPDGQLAYAVIVNWDDPAPLLLDVVLGALRELGAAFRRLVTI